MRLINSVANSANQLCCQTLQTAVLGEVKKYLDLAKDDPSREEFVLGLRNSINKWVAKYRRSDFTGKQSFGCGSKLGGATCV